MNSVNPKSKIQNPKSRLLPPDAALGASVAGLLVIGLVMVYTTTYVLDYSRPTAKLTLQLLWTGLGLAALVVMIRVDYHFWRRWSVPMLGLTLGLLAVLLVIGLEVGGGTRWFLGGSVQPSEVAKLAVVIYIADWLASKGQRIRHVTYGLVPFAILIGFITGLILLQPNFSTACLIALTAFAMFYVAGADLKQLAFSTAMGGLAIALLIVQAPYRFNRVKVFLDPFIDETEAGFQTLRVIQALQSGGIAGVGLGQSSAKFGPVYVWHTDTIFAILGEELGLIGCLAVIGLFVVLVYRGYRVSQQAPDPFGKYLATGITVWLGLQAMINMAVVTAIFPVTGLPLPFISFGGSSLVASLAAVGLLMNISRHAPTTADDRPPTAESVSGGQFSSRRSAVSGR